MHGRVGFRRTVPSGPLAGELDGWPQMNVDFNRAQSRQSTMWIPLRPGFRSSTPPLPLKGSAGRDRCLTFEPGTGRVTRTARGGGVDLDQWQLKALRFMTKEE